jgi:hypothetical protein
VYTHNDVARFHSKATVTVGNFDDDAGSRDRHTDESYGLRPKESGLQEGLPFASLMPSYKEVL